MKKLLIVLALCCVLVTISCSNTDRTCDMDTVQFDTETGKFLPDDNNNENKDDSPSESLNRVLEISPEFVEYLSQGEGNITVLQQKLNDFHSKYSDIFFEMELDASCSDFYYCSTIGFLVSYLSEKNIVLDENTNEELKKYTGLSNNDYLMMNGFWLAYYYDLSEFPISESDYAGYDSRLDNPVGIAQIAEVQQLLVGTILSKGLRLGYIERIDDNYVITNEFARTDSKYAYNILGITNRMLDELAVSGHNFTRDGNELTNPFVETSILTCYLKQLLDQLYVDEIVVGDLIATITEYTNKVLGGSSNITGWDYLDMVCFCGKQIADVDYSNETFREWRKKRYKNSTALFNNIDFLK